MKFSLNLASQPFVNHRRYYLSSGLLWVIGGVLLLVLARGFVRDYRQSRDVSREHKNYSKEIEQLTQRSVALRTELERDETLDTIEKVQFFNSLIARKTFSWTSLFRDLEHLLPYQVQITSIQQRSQGPVLEVEMIVMGKSIGDCLKFMNNLAQSPRFRNLSVMQEGRFKEASTQQISSDVEIVLRVEYAAGS